MNRKIIAILLAALLLAGCSSTRTDSNTSPAETMSPTETLSSNPLLAAELRRGYVRNGSGTDVIGQYAYIKISKETLEGITVEDYTEFCETVVDSSIYNWVSIICDDWTGIQFTGSQYVMATYGEITYEGIIIEDMGIIRQTKDGFQFEAVDGGSSIMETTQPLYPKNVSEEYISLANELPEIVFSTTGSENGLAGTIYTFEGKILSIDEYNSDVFTFYDAIVETDQGKIQISNIYKSTYDASYAQYGDAAKEVFADE